MMAGALLTGTRDEVAEIAHDPRMGEAEAALARFGRTGTVRDANTYARSCMSLVNDAITAELPSGVRRNALRAASVKALDASFVTAGMSYQAGALVWALAHELHDLAETFGVAPAKLRPLRARGGTPASSALSAGQLMTLARELMRMADTPDALDEIQQVMGLSSAETAALFGVTRQAVDQWRQKGVPAERMADVQRIRDVARVLYEELLPDRIPQVVRNAARGLGGRSILDVLADRDGAEAVRGYLARLYAFEPA
jgi:DNA-binding transcriptional regulator YdaS (Cro superfamily)